MFNIYQSSHKLFHTILKNMVFNLSKTRSEVKIIDNSVEVVVHELELAIKRELQCLL